MESIPFRLELNKKKKEKIVLPTSVGVYHVETLSYYPQPRGVIIMDVDIRVIVISIPAVNG